MQKHCLILLLFSLSLFAQKKEILLDENENIITGEIFKEKVKDPYKYHYTIIETDTATVGKLVPTEEIGKMTENHRLGIIDELEKLSGRKISHSQTIVINFYFKEPEKNQRPCIDHYTTDKSYQRFFERNNEYSQFFITEKGFDYNKENVIEDKNGIIKDTAFPFVFHCGNYIIIKPNGQFLRRVSEHRQDEILDKAKENW